MTTLEPLAVPAGPAVLDILPQLESALAGKKCWLPHAEGSLSPAAREISALVPLPETALVVSTSGTTGTPKAAMLSASALTASAHATHERLGGPGRWVLALPAHHIAGIQVLIRSILSETTPSVVDLAQGFSPTHFAEIVSPLLGRDERLYTSLVPGQLHKIFDDVHATEVLRHFDAVLIGGAAMPASLHSRAASEGIRVVRTYGMSETCGGCVYDGVPLSGVRVRVEDGRIVIGGDTVASGYINFPDHPNFAEPGWFRTDDAGTFTDGVLTVHGRLDEAISTGGLTVFPHIVEHALLDHPAVRDCAIVGVPDERLGYRIAAVVVTQDGDPITLAEVRGFITERLDRYAAPRELHIVTELPVRGPGKVDRRALVRMIST
ncbi:o-succinylbenzoate--CoA ligase [Hoyosella rhizosphaerae]|uniref:O-succinylbenzoic acid--CoA ligase MenE n=1 Tax=Hoyosella rhizosphaerae TaxID=1755582 RepID=A0A916UL07_9ACTN|nr:o-succinylbenzoate--CoA ligase [Hoyosella rhizosphaerae]MBN4925275.1 o-succinylbenzoate--CoA ligase [Hoyosella rhizosphaerae]GGC76583.1 putative O-succinylbenzoic acid--CoA ligase MenE [Hoyosella rhizosphaerae]